MVKHVPLWKESGGRITFVVVNTTYMMLLLAVVLVPILKVVIDSFDQRASETVFRLIPETFTLDAYRLIISRAALYRPFLISLYTTSVGTVISMTITSFFAYGLAQRDLPGRTFLLYMALITMVFRAGMIPLFLVVRNLRLMNTLWAVLLVHAMDAYRDVQGYLDIYQRLMMGAIVADNGAHILGHPWHNAAKLVEMGLVDAWRFELIPDTRLTELIDALRSAGMAIEINRRSISSFHDPAYRAFVLRLRASGVQVAVGSDAHNPDRLDAAPLINQFLAELEFSVEEVWAPPQARRS